MDGEVIGLATYFAEVTSVVRISERRIGNGDRTFAWHMIDRLQIAVVNVASICRAISAVNELREYSNYLEDLSVALPGIISEWEACLERLDSERELTRYKVERIRNGRGRPKFHVTKVQIMFLRSLSFSWTNVESILGISRLTLYRRRRAYGLVFEGDIVPDDQLLKELLRLIKLNYPELGQTLLLGRLRAMGFRVTRSRLREMVRAQDPLNTSLRLPGGLTSRMKYSVPGSNSLWYISECHSVIVNYSELSELRIS